MPDAEAKAQDRRLNDRSAFDKLSCRHWPRPAQKIIHEKILQGCCGTNGAQPKTCADSVECEKRLQSMLQSRNPRTTLRRFSTGFPLSTRSQRTSGRRTPRKESKWIPPTTLRFRLGPGWKSGRSRFTGRSGQDAVGFGPDFVIIIVRFGPAAASPAPCGPQVHTKPLSPSGCFGSTE